MIRSPPNTYQRNQFHTSRHNNNSNFKLSSQKCSPPKSLGVACTPKHLLYRVPKSIIKTGGSTQNIGSVIKPREFGKYLEAFRSSPAVPSSVSALPSKELRAESESTSSLLTRAPLAPPATPLLADPTKPLKPCASTDAALNGFTTSSDTQQSKANVNAAIPLHPTPVQRSKPSLNSSKNSSRPAPTPYTFQNQNLNRENDCIFKANIIENPFQPSQKALQRTPPKTAAKPPLAQPQSVMARSPLPVQEERMRIVPAATETQPDSNNRDIRVRVTPSVTSVADTASVLPAAPVRRVTSGNVMHSPPAPAATNVAVHRDTPPKEANTCSSTATLPLTAAISSFSDSVTNSISQSGFESAAHSMSRLLSNGYAPQESSPTTFKQVNKDTVSTLRAADEGQSEMMVENERAKNMVLEPADEGNRSEVSMHKKQTPEVDAVQQYMEKLSKKFVEEYSSASEDSSPERVALLDHAEVTCTSLSPSAVSVSVAPIVMKQYPLTSTRSTSTAMSTSFLESKDVCSKSLMTSFEIDIENANVPLNEENLAVPSIFDAEMEAIKTTHFYKEKELQMELLLQRYGRNCALQELLDSKQQARDEKSLRIESDISLRAARQIHHKTAASLEDLLMTMSPTPKITSTAMTQTSPEKCNKSLALEFSSISTEEPEKVPKVSMIYSDPCISESPQSSYMCNDNRDSSMLGTDGTDEADNVLALQGMQFIPLRSAKLKVDHATKPETIASISEKRHHCRSGEQEVAECNKSLALDFSDISAEESEEMSFETVPENQNLYDSLSQSPHSTSESPQSISNNDHNFTVQEENETSPDGVDESDAIFFSHGMKFIPLRSIKLKPTIGHITNVTSTSIPSEKKETLKSKKRCKSASTEMKGTMSATNIAKKEEDQKDEEGQGQPKSKKCCKKKSPVKPKKRNKVNNLKIKEEVSAPLSVPIEDVITHSASNKKAAASAYVAAYFKNVIAVQDAGNVTGDGKSTVQITKSKKGCKPKQQTCTTTENKAAVAVEPYSDIEVLEEEVVVPPPNKTAKQHKQTKSANVNSKAKTTAAKESKQKQLMAGKLSSNNPSHFPLPEESASFEAFCQFTRSSVEEILSKAAGNNKSAPAEVDMMLIQMWEIQTDVERAEWKQDKPQQQMEKESVLPSGQNELTTIVADRGTEQAQKKVKAFKQKPVPKESVINTPVKVHPVSGKAKVLHNQGPLQSLKPTNSNDNDASAGVLTPVQLPTKAVKKRQKRNDYIDIENESQEIQDFIPKRKISKKVVASQQSGLANKATLYPNQGITHAKILPVKSKMSAIIPKLKTKM